jgi:hypothetical protein
MSDDDSFSDRPPWAPFSQPREVSAFILGMSVSAIVVSIGRVELVVLFVLIALGAKADDVHLPRVQNEPVYALVGFGVVYLGADVLRWLSVI